MTAREALAAITARAQVAAPGPWEQLPDLPDEVWLPLPPGRESVEEDMVAGCTATADAAFIAAARTDVPALAAALGAVLDLHHSDEHPTHPCCQHDAQRWPCTTAQAINPHLSVLVESQE